MVPYLLVWYHQQYWYQGTIPWVVKYIEILYVYQGGCLNPQRMVVNAYKRGLSHGHENQN
jgi:hypothetical protein